MFWKFYAWVFSILSIVGNVSLFLGYPPEIPHAPVTLTDLLQGLVSLFGLVPVFLFAYEKRFLKPIFWKAFFLLFIFFELKDVIFLDRWRIQSPYLFLGIFVTLPSYLAIFLYAFRFFKNSEEQEDRFVRGEVEKDDNFVCVYTTNNEHEAEVIRIGLEGEGIKVILQRKSDVEAPGSFIHRLEVHVLGRDKAKATELLSKLRP